MAVRTGQDGERCSECDQPIAAVDRFCGRCGAHLPPSKAGAAEPPAAPAASAETRQPTAASAEARPQPGSTEAPPQPVASTEPSPGPPDPSTPAPSSTTRGRLDRRTLLAGFGGLAVGGVLGAAIHRRLRSGSPRDEEGLPTAEVEVGDARDLADQLADGGVVRVPEGQAGRIAIIRWDPSYTSESGGAMERYGPEGEGHPVLADDAGLIALSPISTHLGCRVPFCETSQWFEDPCHGARWNSWGEWTGGPAPRGLDRFVSWVREDGVYVVDLTRHIIGPERTAGVLDQRPQGPHCVDG